MISLYNEYKKVYETSMEQIQNLLLIDLKLSASGNTPKEYMPLYSEDIKFEENVLKSIKVRQMPFLISPTFVDQIDNLLGLAKWAKEKMEKEHVLGLRHITLT